jgi:uncharacterized protein (TIGR03437 family)
VRTSYADLGFELQESSNFKISHFVLCLLLTFWICQDGFSQTPLVWSFEGPSSTTNRIAALAVNPRDPATIYAAAPGGGVFKSQDLGATWLAVFDTQLSLQVCSLAVDPFFPDVVYAGTGDSQSPRPQQGVARSADGGNSWTLQQHFTNRPVCALAVDPTNTARVLAGSGEGLFASADSGTSWTKVLASPVTSIAFGPPGIVYAGILADLTPGSREHILTRSADGGQTWTDLPLPPNAGAPVSPANWVTVTANGSAVFVAVSYQASPLSQLDFYATADGGSQWVPAFGVGQARPPMALALDQNNNLYLGGASLLTSATGGSTWTVVPTNGTGFHAAVSAGGTLIVGGDRGLETPLGGAGQISPVPAAEILGVTITPAGRIWAAGPGGLFGLFPGSTSAQTGVPDIGTVGRVSAVAAMNSTNIVTAGAGQVHVSTDDGAQFSSQSVIPVTEARAPYPPVVVDPVLPSSAFVAGRSVYRTTDGGATWTTLSVVDPDPARVVTALAMAPVARNTLFAATACLPEVALTDCPIISAIWRSTNAGQSWTQVSLVAGLVTDFAVDPRQNARVYAAIGSFPAGPSATAGLAQGDLLVSTTNGTVWTSTLGNLPRTGVNSIVIDPTSLPMMFNQPAQTIYVGTDAGVFVSFDAGVRWMDLSAGLPASPVTDLALLRPDGILVAGTFGRGVYRSSLTGITAGLAVHPLSQQLTMASGSVGTLGLLINNLSMTFTAEWQLDAVETPWLNVLQPSGIVRPLSLSQVSVQVSAANLRNGTHIGRLRLSSDFGVQNVVVVVHVTPAPAQIKISAGNNASGLPGTTLPALEVLVLDENQAPLAGVPVTFTITSGSGSLSAREVASDASGIAGVVLTLPEKSGTVQVTAGSGSLAVTFTAIALAAPSIMTDSIFNGVTFNTNTSFGPGSILAIFGENLAAEEAVATGPLPTVLGTTRALIATTGGDVLLPLFSVSARQVRALMPFHVPPGRYLLRIESGVLVSNTAEIGVASFDPGIFTLNGSGQGPGIFFKDNGTIVSASNPAERGGRVSFYAAGLGAVNPAVEAGQPGASIEPLNRTLETPRVFLDRFSAGVLYSGLDPGNAGRYLVTIQVPALVSPATNVSVSMTIGGFASNRVTIPVR